MKANEIEEVRRAINARIITLINEFDVDVAPQHVLDSLNILQSARDKLINSPLEQACQAFTAFQADEDSDEKFDALLEAYKVLFGDKYETFLFIAQKHLHANVMEGIWNMQL